MQQNKYLKISYLIFFVAFCVSLFKISSFDIFWHIKVGEYIVNNLKIIDKNIFSYTFPENSWTPTYWLFEIIIFFIYKFSGFYGLIIFKGIIVGFTFALIAEHFSKKIDNLWLFYIFLIAAIDMTIFRIILRPHIFTFLGFSFLIIFIDKLRETGIKKYFYLIFPILFFLWSNLHSGVIFGVLIFLIYILSQLFNVILNNGNDKTETLNMIYELFFLFSLSFIATLLTPSGINLYLYVFDHTKIDTVILLEEFAKLSFHEHFKQIVIITLFSVLPILILLREKRLSFFNIMMFVYAILLLQKGIRFIPDSTFILFPNLIDALISKKYFIKFQSFNIKSFAVLVIFSIIYIFHVHFISYSQNDNLFSSGLGINKNALPVNAALKLNPEKDRIFNSFSIGGYLIWKFDGKLKVFQDGRIHAYPFSFFKEINDASIDTSKWKDLINKYNINTVILSKSEASSFQIETLKDELWKCYYEDANFILLSKLKK